MGEGRRGDWWAAGAAAGDLLPHEGFGFVEGSLGGRRGKRRPCHCKPFGLD